jgi:hypothetical protein
LERLFQYCREFFQKRPQKIRLIKVPDEQDQLTYFDETGKLICKPNPNYPPRVISDTESAHSGISTGKSMYG